MKSKVKSMVLVLFIALTMSLLIQGVYAQEQKKEGEKKEEVKPAPAPEEGQRPGEGRRGGDRDRGPRRGFDPSAMQERFLSRIKETIGSTDEEWKAIEPLAKKVLDAQTKARMGGYFGRREGSEGVPEVEALRNVLASEQAKPEEIKQKLEAFRNMRKQNEEELKKAQGELKKVLTVKQEAQLVLVGTLE